MNLFNLKEKVAIVTGGNGGIGLAYAKGLVKAGAKVAIWGRNSAKNELAKKELESFGGEIMIFAADLTNAAEAREAFKATTQQMQAEAIVPRISGVTGGPALYTVIRRD